MSAPVKTFAQAGDTVRFINENGYQGELLEARAAFTPGQRLVVADCDIQNWSSSYAFEGHAGRFNTVMFRHEPFAGVVKTEDL